MVDAPDVPVQPRPRAELLPFQEQHTIELFEILLSKGRGLNGSDTGVGKTYVSLKQAILLGLQPFVVAPYAALPGWIEVAKEFGVELAGIANYETLINGRYYERPVLDEEGALSGKSKPCPYIKKVFRDGTVAMAEEQTTTAAEERARQPEAELMVEQGEEEENTQGERLVGESDEEQEEDEDETNAELDNDPDGDDEHKRDLDEHGRFDKFAKLRKKARIEREKKTHVKRGKFYFEFDFPAGIMLIFDEAHRMKNASSVTSKLLDAATPINNTILLLSATISDKIRTFNAFGVFFGLYENHRAFAGWMRRQMTMLKVRHNAQKLDDTQRRLDVIHRALYPYMRRIQKKKLTGALFPAERIVAQCLELPETFEIRKLYDELRQVFEELKDKEKRALALAKLMRIRQKVEILKVPIFVSRAKQEVAAGRSVVIFTNFVETISHLQGELNCECVIHGQQTMAERQWSIRQFQSNKAHIIIVNIQSGGVALSLHDLHGRQRVALHNVTWNGVHAIQAFGRIHRANGRSEAIQYLLYVKGTYEERIAELINEKIGVLSGINDGQLHGTQLTLEQVLHDATGVPIQVTQVPAQDDTLPSEEEMAAAMAAAGGGGADSLAMDDQVRAAAAAANDMQARRKRPLEPPAPAQTTTRPVHDFTRERMMQDAEYEEVLRISAAEAAETAAFISATTLVESQQHNNLQGGFFGMPVDDFLDTPYSNKRARLDTPVCRIPSPTKPPLPLANLVPITTRPLENIVPVAPQPQPQHPDRATRFARLEALARASKLTK